MRTSRKNKHNLLNVLVFFYLMAFVFHLYAESLSLKEKVDAIIVDGIQITELKENNGKLVISGVAKDNGLISTYMRQLDKEVGPPNLEYIKKEKRDQKTVSAFSISLKKSK